MITVKFEPGQTFAKADGLWKYDRDQDLYIEGLNLPANVEIDFSLANKTGQSIPVAGVTTGGATKCAIPNSLLAADMSNDYTIYAYIYQQVGTGAETTHKIALGVKARPSRLGQDTPVDPNPFEDAIDQVNDAAARAEYAMALAEQEVSAIKADRDQIQDNKDGVAQLDTSVSALQAANVRYSSRFSNALIGHATGSGTVVVQDAAEAAIPALEVAGKSEQVVTTGAQLFDVDDGIDAIQHDDDGWITVNIDNTTGTAIKYVSYNVKPSKLIQPQTNYLVVCEAKDVHGVLNARIVSDDQNNPSQFSTEFFVNGVVNGYYQNVCTAKNDFGAATYMLRTILNVPAGAQATAKIRLSVLEDTSITQDTFAYQPFTGGKPSPSPDYPQKISGTGTVGTGAQLFDIAHWKEKTITTKGSVKWDGMRFTLTAGISGDCFTSYAANSTTHIPVKPNTKYTLTWDCSGSSGRVYIFREGKEEGLLSASNSKKILNINTKEEQFITVRFGVENAGESATYWDIMLNEGDAAIPWEPYTGGQPAPSEEYPQVINVRAQGAQLFDANTIQPIIDSKISIVNNNDGSISAKGTSTHNAQTNLSKINLPPGKYYISGSIGDIKAIALVQYNNQIKYYINRSFDVIEGSDVNIYIQVDAGKTVDGTIYPMLNAGDTAIPWEPYRAPQTVPIQLTTPLHGIGDVRDRIRLKDGEWGIERNIKIAVYDGVKNGAIAMNDGWDTMYPGFVHCYLTQKDDWLIGQKHFMSDTFPCTTEADRNFENMELSCHTSNNWIYLFAPYELVGANDGDDEITRIKKINTWIQSRNFKVMYDIATPTWEPFSAATQAALNALATYPGYTSITVDAGGPAAEISLDYVQDIKAAMAAQHQKIKAEVDEQLAYILSLLPESTQAAMIDTETNKLILESEELL